jgi:hypothetical protein
MAAETGRETGAQIGPRLRENEKGQVAAVRPDPGRRPGCGFAGNSEPDNTQIMRKISTERR